ncbi:MAG TPA: YoaK family protein, partial [Gemmataceae bacterium]|nr:YoaK family protein [Gemmataceae bacterium]
IAEAELPPPHPNPSPPSTGKRGGRRESDLLGGDVADKQTPEIREKAWLALVLALVAGCIDAVGYMVLVKLFTAHMSGNSAAAAVYTGEGSGTKAFHRAFPIPIFILGVAIGAALSETLARSGLRRIFTVAVTLEAILLLLFLLWGGPALANGTIPEEPAWRFYLLVALPTLAMGIQNATLRRVGGVTVRTTYISGMLTNVAEQTVQYLFWLRDHAAEHRGRLISLLRLSTQQPSFSHGCLQLSIWFAFVVGAVAGVWATLHWGLLSLVFPIGCLGVIAAFDLIQPIFPPRDGTHKPEWT